MSWDLREWLREIDQLAELQSVEGADRDYEIGAITDLTARQRGPALLFDKIVGHEGHGRVLSCSMSNSRRLGSTLRLGSSLSDLELVSALRGMPEQWNARMGAFPPVEISNSRWKTERPIDDFDLTDLPAPLWHEGDGGHYLGTGCVVITRDPDTDELNAGVYRVMVHARDRLGLFVEPIHGAAQHIQKYHEREEACPVVVSFGHHPLLLLAAAMPIPHGKSELAYAGAMNGESLEVVLDTATGLPVPAESELAISGWIQPGDLAPEGPFGEFTGYFAGGRMPRPVIQVGFVYAKPDPILLGSLPSKPPFDHSYWRAVLESSLLMERLAEAGASDVKAVWRPEAGCASFWTVVAIRQRYAGHARQVGYLAATVAEAASMGRYVVVVDDDVDVTSLDELFWVIGTRTDPSTSLEILSGLPSNPLDPMMRSEDPTKWYGSRAIIDACRPYDRADDFPKVVEVSPELHSSITEKFGDTLPWLDS